MTTSEITCAVSLGEVIAVTLNGGILSAKIFQSEVLKCWYSYEHRCIVVEMKDGDQYQLTIKHTVEYYKGG